MQRFVAARGWPPLACYLLVCYRPLARTGVLQEPGTIKPSPRVRAPRRPVGPARRDRYDPNSNKSSHFGHSQSAGDSAARETARARGLP